MLNLYHENSINYEKKTIKQIKSRLRNFAETSPYNYNLRGKEILNRKCAVINKAFFGNETQKWLSPKELLEYIYSLKERWEDTWKDTAGGLPFVACEQLINVLTDFMSEGHSSHGLPSTEVSTPAEIIRKYVNLNGKLADDEGDISRELQERLGSAIWQKNPELVEKIISLGADVNYAEDSHYPNSPIELPLIAAVERGDCEVAKVLINNGADSQKKSPIYPHSTPYKRAILKGNLEMVQLMTMGSDAIPQEDDSLFAAVLSGDINLVKFLIGRGADVNPKPSSNAFYRTPLSRAIADGKIAIAKLLVKAGADVNAEATIDGDSILSLAEDRCKRNPAFIEFLKQNGARYYA